MLRIHDILVWIRIRGSMPLTNGSRSGSGSIFINDLQDANKNLIKKKKFSAYYFLKVLKHYLLKKVKSQKEVTKQQKSKFFLLFLLNVRRIGSGSIHLTNGSGSGSRRLKITWIRRIRIRNTAEYRSGSRALMTKNLRRKNYC